MAAAPPRRPRIATAPQTTSSLPPQRRVRVTRRPVLCSCCSRAGRRSSSPRCSRRCRGCGALPRGDGHPVMVFPGMGANDLTTFRCAASCAASATSPQPGARASTSGRARRAERCADDVKALRRPPWPTGQPDRLEPRRALCARDGQAAPGADALRRDPRHALPGHPKATNAWRLYEFLSGERRR